MVARTIQNSDILTDFQIEKAEMDERQHLLTEENQMLLEQVTLLKQHYDTFNKDYSDKVDDAEMKISSYDSLSLKFQKTYKDLVDYQKNNQFIENKLREKERTLGMIEEKRKSEVKELNKLRTEHSLMQQEVNYFKDQVDKLNYRISQDRDVIDKQVRLTKDKESNCQDMVMRLESDLERAKNECRKINKHLKERQVELNDVIRLNDEYQIQIQDLKDKQFEAGDLGRSYKEKLEKLKFEKEKMKLQEENYLKRIQKLEEDSRADLARKNNKHDSILASKDTRAKQKFDELDDKYTHTLSEIDHLKSMLEKKDMLTRQLESEVNGFNRKESKIREQYEAQLKEVQMSYRNLQLDVNRLETDKEKYEITLDKMTRDSRNNERRLEMQVEDHKNDLENLKDDVDMLRDEKRKLLDRLQNLA